MNLILICSFELIQSGNLFFYKASSSRIANLNIKVIRTSCTKPLIKVRKHPEKIISTRRNNRNRHKVPKYSE
jgi:hypothetical protein